MRGIKDQVDKTQLVGFLQTCRAKPLIYVDTVLLPRLNIKLDAGQREVLEKMFRLKKLLVPTHHAFGKSLLCALFIMTIINLYPTDCIITSLAPTFRQVRDILWAELRRIFEKCYGPPFVNGTMSLTRYEIGPKAFAVGIAPARAAKDAVIPQNISGIHARVVVVIIDEMGGVADQVIEQLEAITSAGEFIYIIGIGNPLNVAGRFGRMCLSHEGEGYHITQKRAYDSPNMKANGLINIDAIRTEAAKIRGLTREQRIDYYENKHYERPYKLLLSPGWVMRCYLKWGESPYFFSRCIGDWATATEDSLVPLQRVEEIMQGTYKDAEGKIVWCGEENGVAKWNGSNKLNIGIDCSGEGADKVVIMALEGNRQFHYKSFTKTWQKNEIDFRGIKLKEDGPFIAAYIYENIILANTEKFINFYLDCTGGFGDTIYSNLMKYDLNKKFVKIRRVIFGAQPENKEIYADNIAEMAFWLAEDIKSPEGFLLEENEDLKNQISNRKKETAQNLKNKLESKRDYKTRAGQSPDDFDAFMLANAARRLSQKMSKYAYNSKAEDVVSFENGEW